MERRLGWPLALVAVIAAVLVGVLSYNAGVAHGLAVSPALASAPAAGAAYVWRGPWSWGWGFGFAPLFFVLVWFVMFGLVIRLVWGGRRRRAWSGGGCGAPYAFDEWHRRAHEEMNKHS